MPPTTESTKTEASKTTDAHGPVVVDLGKKRRKQIRQLRKGHGKLMDEVSRLIEELRVSGSIAPSTQPVVIVVRQKRRTKSFGWP